MKKLFFLCSFLSVCLALFLVMKNAEGPEVYFSGQVSLGGDLREKNQKARYAFFAFYDLSSSSPRPFGAFKYVLNDKELKEGRFSFKIVPSNLSIMGESQELPEKVRLKLRIQETPQVSFTDEAKLKKEWQSIDWGTRNLDLAISAAYDKSQ